MGSAASEARGCCGPGVAPALGLAQSPGLPLTELCLWKSRFGSFGSAHPTSGPLPGRALGRAPLSAPGASTSPGLEDGLIGAHMGKRGRSHQDAGCPKARDVLSVTKGSQLSGVIFCCPYFFFKKCKSYTNDT